MTSYNKVLLMGNLTRDPEVRATSGGASLTELGLAVSRSYVSKGGEKRDETAFVDVTFWGRRGEVIAEHFKKGEPIFIEGRLTYRQWEAKDGGKRSKLSVTGENFEFVGGGKGKGGGKSRPAEDPGDVPNEPEFDDVPF